MTSLALMVCTLLFSSPAFASEGATDPLPAEPKVDLSTIAPTATVRPMNMNDKPHQAYAELLVDRIAVVAGETFRVGVRLVPDADWHSYWKSPGDVGMPLTINWRLPDGAKSSKVEFPIPQRFDVSGIVSYGYDGPMMLFTEVTLPESTPPGPIQLGADAEWLVCEAQCIQGEVSLTTSVEVAAAAGDPTPWAPLFDHYAKHHPTQMAKVEAFAVEGALNQTAYRPEEAFEIVFRIAATSDTPLKLDPTVGTWPTYVPIVDMNELYPFEYATKMAEDGSLLVTMSGETLEVEKLPTDSRVGGLFQVKVGEEWVRAEYTMAVPWVATGTEVEKSPSPLFAMAVGEPPELPPEGEGGGDPESAATDAAPVSTFSMLLFAFLGGVLLNIMPCVFPVITLKAFGLVSHADSGAWAQRKAGLAYTAGILSSFLVLAIAVLALKASVGSVGWGFQFQSPIYVAALATIVFAFGLSLFGVFEIPVVGGNAALKAGSQGGIMGDFMNGVFATLLATPCTAPFLGTATGFAFSQSAGIIVLFFLVIGFGLAAPFLAISFIPALFKMLPRPGAWMETFKQLMGFTLIATTIWMVDVLSDQVGAEGAIGFIAFLCFVAIGSWIFGRFGGLEHTGARQATMLGVGALVSAGGGWYFLNLEIEPEPVCETGCIATDLDFAEEVPWQAFSQGCVDELHGELLFIDFTASWCLTCKVNERTVLETDAMRAKMEAFGVVPLKADWTKRDPVITEWLQKFDRAGVPFYLVIATDGTSIALPEVITAGIVIEALEQAASRSGDGTASESP